MLFLYNNFDIKNIYKNTTQVRKNMEGNRKAWYNIDVKDIKEKMNGRF